MMCIMKSATQINVNLIELNGVDIQQDGTPLLCVNTCVFTRNINLVILR